MLAVLDAAYSDDVIAGACVLLDDYASSAPVLTRQKQMTCSAESYVPGEFYRRELPILSASLMELDALPEVVLIDGYVWLGRENQPGLGARLYEQFDRAFAVIGAAKSPFAGDDWSTRVLRGDSQRPLYITSAGMDAALAADVVRQMDGPHRVPAMCKLADRLARDAVSDKSRDV